MKKVILHTFILLTLFSACKNDDPIYEENPLDQELEAVLISAANGEGLSYFQLPDSDNFSAIPQDPLNPITKEKVELGKLLYHETGLASSPKLEIGKNKYSCASCHFAEAGFQAGRFQGIAEGGMGFGINGEGRVKSSLYPADQVDVQPIRTPSAMNGAYQKNMLWNGQFGATGVNTGTESQWKEDTPLATNHLGYEGLEIQAIAGLGVHRLEIKKEFLDETGYTTLFDLAFGDVEESKRYSAEYAGLAIAAYERTMLANKAPFQQFLKGEYEALSDQAKRGAILFFEKAECSSCHTGPALSSMEFHALGMIDLWECGEQVFQSSFTSDANKGRASFTGNDADLYQFKVPQLYNLKDSPFYGHGSSFKTIQEVIEYKNNGQSQNPNVTAAHLADGFYPLNLSADEVQDISVFIEEGLYDPNLTRYVPNSVLSGNCFPFNDALARDHLGCE